MQLIENHIEHAEAMGWKDIYCDMDDLNFPWKIEDWGDTIELSVFMDNFDMGEYLKKIEVPDSAIVKEEHS
jgi:hypothetical protein